MENEAPQSLAAPIKQTADLSLYGKAGILIGAIGFVVYWAVYASSGNTPGAQALIAKAYMYGWTFWMTMTLGCLALSLLHYTVRGSWGLSVLRILEAGGGVGSLVTMFIAYIPIMVVQNMVYPWTSPGSDTVLLQKASFYNPLVFDVRQIVLFGIWILLAAKLRGSSLREDGNKDPNEAQKRTNLAAPGMVIMALTATLAATDWVMSMDAHWYSTMFGPIMLIAGCLAALSFATMLVLLNRDKEPFNQILTPALTKDLGNMLLTLTMLWAYFNFSQFVIIWNGNLPSTASYYTTRAMFGFNVLGGLLIAFSFAIPFLALITPKVKRLPIWLLRVACLIVVVRFFDIYYIVAPMYSETFVPSWREILSVAAVGGLWMWAFGSAIKNAGLYPTHDMRLMEAKQHGS